MLALRFADQVARNHGRDPWKIAGRLGIRVKRANLPTPHRELYVQRRGRHKPVSGLAIATSCNALEARELIAHGVAHHLMHAGDRITGRSRAVWSGRHEREAEDFAAFLLIPDRLLRMLEGENRQKDIADLAEAANVSCELASRRLRLAARLPGAPLD